jgi:hypothetical protein
MKREPGTWGYNWATLSLGDMNTETWSSRLWVGCKFCKQIISAKSVEVKTRQVRYNFLMKDMAHVNKDHECLIY